MFALCARCQPSKGRFHSGRCRCQAGKSCVSVRRGRGFVLPGCAGTKRICRSLTLTLFCFIPVRELKRRALLAEPFPDDWVSVLNDDVAHYAYLNDEEKARLHDDLRCFVEEKTWEAGGDASDHALTDEMKVAIAAQACLLLLGWDDARRADLFPNVSTIIVYPSGYRATDKQTLGIVQTEESTGRLGEAWNGSLPVVLSWQSAREGGQNAVDGHNVVLHEFAHKLDMQSGGTANGVPHLPDSDAYDAWAEALSVEYEALQHDAEKNHKSFLDHYGATNEAEFFAVATEAFFEKPVKMRDQHAALYQAFMGFYEQDTAARVEAINLSPAEDEDEQAADD